jgi:GTP cyclohydrolase IA
MKNNNEFNSEIIEKNFKEILEEGLKLDINDPNLIETPKRVALSYKEIFSGLRNREEDIEDLFSKCFMSDYKGIIAEKNIVVFSMCPHHFLPIRYDVALGYIPGNCTLGLSKLARLVELVAKKPILQEDFTKEIVELIDKHIEPLGVICEVKGAHYCMQMRGAKQKDAVTITSEAKGVFLSKQEMELKFYNLINEK